MSRIGAAVSGGRDSVALLHILKQSGANVIAVNVEHGIRGEESVRDSKFVAELCKSWGIELCSYGVDAPSFAKENGYTLEQAARILRYRIFDGLLDAGKCDFIALAHHADDQAETVLMRILRGTGIRGLAGMKEVNGRYIRPLLEYTRADIDDYIERNGLQYVDDATNDDESYTRNFLRGEIARLKTRFPDLCDKVARLARNAAEADAYIEEQMPQIAVKNGEVHIKTSDCANTTIGKRLITRAAAELGVRQDIEEKHLKLALGLARGENGKYLNLTHGLNVHKDGDRLVFALNAQPYRFERRAFEEGVFEGSGVCVKTVDLDHARKNIATGRLFVDADKIPREAVIRSREDGDVIKKFGGGTKSLGDYLTDKKYPLRERDGLKVVAVGNRVLAVFGVDISEDVRIDETTRRVYELKLEK